jgi:preprotein translocase subunit Sec61beta
LIREISVGDIMAKKDGGGIQQAAGLIRYFDEESEDAWKITPTQIYLTCIGLSGFIYLVNEGVVSWIMGMF